VVEPLTLHVSAIAILRNIAGDVVMVESRYPGMAESFWALPGGLLEPGESITDALAREVREEAGLDVIGSTSVVAMIWLETSDGGPPWVTSVCEPEGWRGDLTPDDPDGVTLGAAAVPLPDAIERLAALPWGLSAPIVHRLRGAPPGGVWVYRWPGAGPWDGNGPAQLVRGPETVRGRE
jgi:8-oxo-dGTP diphosphatase